MELDLTKRNFKRFKNAKVVDVSFKDDFEIDETIYINFDNGLQLELDIATYYPSIQINKLKHK